MTRPGWSLNGAWDEEYSQNNAGGQEGTHLTSYPQGRTAAQTTRATSLTLQDVVLRAAFDTPRVVRTGAVELTEWDLLASLMTISQNHNADGRRSHSQEPPTSGSRKPPARSGSTVKHKLEHRTTAKHYESLGCGLQKQAKTVAVQVSGRQGDATGPQGKQWDTNSGIHPGGVAELSGHAGRR